MYEEREGTAHTLGRLLSEEEKIFCEHLAQSGERLINKRAAALVVLDAGSTRAEAGEQFGLTLGQVRYLLAAFRQKRLSMFMEGVLMETEGQPKAEEIILKKEPEEKETLEEIPVVEEVKKGKKKKQKKEKKVKVKGKKDTKKDKKLKKTKGDAEKGKKGKDKKGKGKKNKKGKGKAGKKK